MAVYTHLTEADVQTIGEAFGLTVRSSEPIATGSANTNLRLRTDAGPFMLTLIEDNPLARTLELGRLLLVLEAHGFRTSRPRRSASGALAGTFRGKPVMVKPYIEGDVCFDPSDAVLRQVGDAMARLHEIPPPPFLSGRRLDGLWKATPAVTRSLDAASGTDVAGRLHSLGLADVGSLSQGLIHGDICYDNILVHEGRLAAVIDFEEAFCGPRVFDIGMTLVGLCRTPGGLDPERSRAVIEGYESLRPLAAGERAALPRMAEYAALLLACWRFWKFHLDAPDPAKAGHHLTMVRIAEGIRSGDGLTRGEAVAG